MSRSLGRFPRRPYLVLGLEGENSGTRVGGGVSKYKRESSQMEQGRCHGLGTLDREEGTR